MARNRRIGDLDIHEDATFQSRTWLLERIGWIVILLILAAALLGLCGSAGPLGRGSAGEQGGPLSLRYARFPRHAAPTLLEVRLDGATVRDGTARVWMEQALLENFDLEHVTPEPVTVELGAGHLTYVFRVAEPGGPLTITFSLRAERYGPHTGRIGLPDGPTLRFRQFVYP